jgi:hypothetical protein
LSYLSPKWTTASRGSPASSIESREYFSYQSW